MTEKFADRQKKNAFKPDYAIHPGEILGETLTAQEMKKSELAERTGISVKTISLIINCKERVTPETAIKLERVLGVSASLWYNLDSMYELYKAKQNSWKRLEDEISLAQKFPYKELIERGFINKPENDKELVESLLNFFSVASLKSIQDHYEKMIVTYRHSTSFNSDPLSLISWLRIGEILQSVQEVNHFDKDSFLAAIKNIRQLTNEQPSSFLHKMEKACRDSGVELVFVPEFKGTRVSGSSRWITKDKALIMQSLRHKREDHFWFTFFHEAIHILKHSKKKLYVEDIQEDSLTDDEEKEANVLASNLLIPESAYKEFLNRGSLSRISILNFAKRINISPGIIVGRLQRDKQIDYNHFNNLVQKFHFE